MNGFWRAAVILVLSPVALMAQTQMDPCAQKTDTVSSQSEDNNSSNEEPTTVWPHSDNSRFWISGQSNTIFQGHPAFHARYTGPNSLLPRGEYKVSLVNTLFLGLQATSKTEFLVDVESAGGRGISQALGLAGFTNLDVVRNPTLGAAPYLARLMLHQIISLGDCSTKSERGSLSLATNLPARRVEFRIGKFGTADFFDVNSVGSDSHLQFLNWTIDNNGAYDYPADTRGYTWGAIVEFHDGSWGLRFGEMLMPKIANDIRLEWNLHRAHSENIELELHDSLVHKRNGVIRLLSYFNHANMGVYRDAVRNFLAGLTPVPDITAHPFHTTLKYGFGINAEQELTGDLRVFGRWGWNEGQHESFAYTEVDQTVSFGGDLRGTQWGRKNDKLGLAVVSNGISADHQAYLALGGLGFLLGDGRLNYGREDIIEGYYNAQVWRGVFMGPDVQHIWHPGYNRDRGPVWVGSARLHIEF